MVRFSAVANNQLNTLWHDTYGWVTSAGVHFIADAYTVVSFWTTGEIDVYGINTDETSALADIIKDTHICTENEVLKVLLSEDDFVIEV